MAKGREILETKRKLREKYRSVEDAIASEAGEGKPSNLLVRFIYNYGEAGNADEAIPEVDGPTNGHAMLRIALGL